MSRPATVVSTPSDGAEAQTKSTGSRSVVEVASTASMIPRASSIIDSSTRLRPVPCPMARSSVKAMAPPTTSVSTRPARWRIVASLSEIFAPPRTATNGRSGESIAPLRYLSSASSRRPAVRGRPSMASGTRHHRGVGTMRRTEGVLAVEITVGREPPREFGVAVLLRLVEPEVLQQDDATRFDRIHSFDGRLVHAVPARETHRTAKEFGEPGRRRRQGERRFETGPRRPAEVTHQHARSTTIENRSNGRNRRPDSAVVRDLTLGHRNVEVDAE